MHTKSRSGGFVTCPFVNANQKNTCMTPQFKGASRQPPMVPGFRAHMYILVCWHNHMGTTNHHSHLFARPICHPHCFVAWGLWLFVGSVAAVLWSFGLSIRHQLFGWFFALGWWPWWVFRQAGAADLVGLEDFLVCLHAPLDSILLCELRERTCALHKSTDHHITMRPHRVKTGMWSPAVNTNMYALYPSPTCTQNLFSPWHACTRSMHPTFHVAANAPSGFLPVGRYHKCTHA